MHGVILNELKGFVDAAFGDGGWKALLGQARLGGRIYLAIEEYPDAEALALVGAASKLSGKPVGDLLEAFGEYLVPGLLKMYGSLVQQGWDTLDIIEHTEETVHRVVRMRNRGARPPYLKCERKGLHELLVVYDSERKMCRLGLGIIRGIAKKRGEKVAVTETQCMLDGAPNCRLSIKSAAEGAGTRPGDRQ